MLHLKNYLKAKILAFPRHSEVCSSQVNVDMDVIQYISTKVCTAYNAGGTTPCINDHTSYFMKTDQLNWTVLHSHILNSIWKLNRCIRICSSREDIFHYIGGKKSLNICKYQDQVQLRTCGWFGLYNVFNWNII